MGPLGTFGGGIWADVMNTLHPDRIVAMWLRSGSVVQFRTHEEFPQPQVPAAAYANPIMLNPGVKEKATFKPNPKGKEGAVVWQSRHLSRISSRGRPRRLRAGPAPLTRMRRLALPGYLVP